MDAKDEAQRTSTSEQNSLLERHRLARLVVVGSFLTLFLLVFALIGLAQSTNTQVSEAAKNAFTAVLPVLAGWVGTVLAFYFSAASQERTSESLDKVITRTTGSPLASKLVSEKMIAFAAIVALQDLDKEAKDVSISTLQQAFKKELPTGGKVTRLIFVENGVFKYVLHESALNAFIAKSDDPATAPDKKFADMLKDEETLRQISKLVVFVSTGTTLADAKAALEKMSGAQDIIVTATGNTTEPMLGWLTNIDLTKALQVR